MVMKVSAHVWRGTVPSGQGTGSWDSAVMEELVTEELILTRANLGGVATESGARQITTLT
jgi:hypothetical protein